MSYARPLRLIKSKPNLVSEIFIKLIYELGSMSSAERRILAENAEVSLQTLDNWAFGVTCNPHSNTLVKVAHQLGYELTLVRHKLATVTPIRRRA